MAVTPQLIKELREMTSAGMMDCKKALDATNGNLDEAVVWLRENGLAKAAKKADRVAAEGVTYSKENAKKVIIFEVNSETDFVSKNEKFMTLIENIADALLKGNFKTSNDAKKIKLANGQTIADACIEATATIGEKIELRRALFVNKAKNLVSLYNHANKRISVVLEFDDKMNKEDAYNLAMHVAAMSPKFLNQADVPQELKDSEMHIIKETTDTSKLPPAKVDEVLAGKLSKKLSDIVLLEQGFVMDEKQKVGQFIKQKGSVLKTMLRFEVGEGIEKDTTDFATEVAAQLKGK